MRDPSTMHGRAITHFCVAQQRVKEAGLRKYKCCLVGSAY